MLCILIFCEPLAYVVIHLELLVLTCYFNQILCLFQITIVGTNIIAGH